MAPYEPLWMSHYNENSQIITSNAVYINRNIDLVTQFEVPGRLDLHTRSNILPRSPESWYLAVDE